MYFFLSVHSCVLTLEAKCFKFDFGGLLTQLPHVVACRQSRLSGFRLPHSYLSNPLISFPPAGCWVSMWRVRKAVGQSQQADFPLYFPSATWSGEQLKFQISFCRYQAHNNFTAQQSHCNELPEAIKASFLWRDLHEYKKDGFLAGSNQRAFQPRCHIGFVVCQKPLQEASLRSSNQHVST